MIPFGSKAAGGRMMGLKTASKGWKTLKTKRQHEND
jgi:hypothetical protein